MNKKHEFKVGDRVRCSHFHSLDDKSSYDTVIAVDKIKVICEKQNGGQYHAHKSIVEHYHE